jgi:two-component system, OmpR family, sensor histidine kinase KdpD
MEEKDRNVQRFLDLVKRSRRGKFKIYIGMSAGVGKTFRMLQEAHALIKSGIDVKVGFVETHQRKETEALLQNLPMIPRRQLFYKGKSLEEMDVQAIINARPEVVIVDELAHTNIEGSKNEKRWQDVIEILEAGINVISAVNIQHLESLNEEVKQITGIEIKERIPNSILAQADEVVNIDLTADELITRLRDGKIYKPDKIETALNNFFKSENILQLRELALKEVAAQVERKVDAEVVQASALRHERFLACISSNERSARMVIRKTARLASYYNGKWCVLYVQTPLESPDKIALDKQRFLINNFKLATELGAEVVNIKHAKVADCILEQALLRQVTTICMGKPKLGWFSLVFSRGVLRRLLGKLNAHPFDVVILT